MCGEREQPSDTWARKNICLAFQNAYRRSHSLSVVAAVKLYYCTVILP